MEPIVIDGIIGIHNNGRMLRDKLKEADGKDIKIEISSPGGFVYDGFEMYNIIKNYSGNVHMHIMGLAASMASYIALAGDKITAESNSVFMIHNAWTIGMGDHNELRKMSDEIEQLSLLMARTYSRRTGKKLSEIKELMNAETFFFGKDIKKNGFVDEVLPDKKNNGTKKESLAMASLYINDCYDQVRKSESTKEDLEKAAALYATVGTYDSNAKLIDEEWSKSESETRWRSHVDVESSEDLPNRRYSKRFGWWDVENAENFGAYKFPHWDFKEGQGEFVNIAAVRNGLARLSQSNIPADDKSSVERLLRRYLTKWQEQQEEDLHQTPLKNTEGEKNKMEVSIMTLDELNAQYPTLYADVKAEGVRKERDRVKAHITMGTKCGAIEFAHKCILDGKSITEESIMAEYLSSGKNKADIQAKQDDSDSVEDLDISPKSNLSEDDIKDDLLGKVLEFSKKGGTN